MAIINLEKEKSILKSGIEAGKSLDIIKQDIIKFREKETQGLGFLERLKLGFGGRGEKLKQQELEKKLGLKGKFDIGDIADIAGESLPIIGAILGGAGGTFMGTPISTIPGAAIGATAGESLKRAIGQALGVRKEITGLEEIKGVIGVGAATYVGGKLFQKVGKYIGSRIPKLGSLLTGQSEQIIKTAFKNPHLADKALISGDKVLRKSIETGRKNSIKMLNAFLTGHKQAFNKMAGIHSTKLVEKKVLIFKFETLLRNSNVKINPKGKLNFTISKIKANPGEVTKIQNAYAAIKDWDDFTLAGINRLKQLIGTLRKFEDIAGKTSRSPTLGSFYHDLNEVIKQNLPKKILKDYITLNKKFEDNIELYEDTVNAFWRGDPFKRLASAYSKNNDALRQTLQFYESQTGEKIFPLIAGREIAAEGAWAIFNPRSYVDFFYSPKAQLKTITELGKAAHKINPILEGILKLKK